MDQKKLRETLGFFSTGVIIACARRRNFLAENFFSEKFFHEKELMTKFEEFWQNFLQGNPLAQKLEKKIPTQNFLEKIKKVFAAEFFGMTINSFTSVSLNPPLVSFCIDNKSSNLSLFKKNLYFSLNVLSKEQQGLARAFATPKNSTKWEVEPYFFGQKGNPIFQKSLAFFECKKHRVIKCGDHHIVVGEVLDYGVINESSPLIYYRGKFEA
jgi:flavin reductase (DIM6/NTAB) family NADH-FMN oxidoreductase RutF